MRLYLSSFRMGDHAEELVRLAGPGARVAVIANACDGAPVSERLAAVEREIVALTALGLRPDEVDLRDYDGDSGGPGRLRRDLDAYDALWVRGGNVFVLRHAMQRSGADEVIVEGLARDAYVYAGYSAGPCVLAPSLRGLELCDDATEVTRLHGTEPVWDGLGVLDHAVVPHVQTPDHPESAALDQVAEMHRATGVPHVALRDGQVLVVDGDTVTVV
jgi:dipeptidase E